MGKLITDGLVNVASGLGTAKSKRFHNRFEMGLMNDFHSMDNAFQTNWLARQIVEVPAEDMTREWRDIKSNDANAIRAVEDRLMLPSMVNEALCWARLYGGGGILMLTDQDLTKPLNLNAIKRGSLRRLLTFDRWDMQAMTLNTWDPLADNYLLPEFYVVRGGKQQIHWSHFARFMGARLPLRQMVWTQGWGDSELRKCLDDVMDMVASKDGIAELMQEANVDVIKKDGLSNELASGEDSNIIDRYATFSQMKSVVQLALLDGTETYDRKTLNLGGVAPVIELFMTWISGAADIPVTRLFGTSAKGLNATGEGDLKNYYNSIRAKQLSQLDPPMRQIDEVLVRSALGHFPDDFNYRWNPLQQLTDEEIARTAKLRADTDLIYHDMGAVEVSQIQRNLQSAEQYQFEDEDIEQREEDERNGNILEEAEPPVMDAASLMDAWKQMTEDGVPPESIQAVLGC
ncbi:portal protein [Edwardsiella phage PEi21]|uniref:Putative portal protein n=1 Tax=Edwardsiella phage PEi21 TaxID=1325372 RepID=N0DQN3_9CAUD|nr:portal protein [Edwardsiella phage PEi21]BAN16814.1 putative portal protein [Edwardsiella phage PEi21]